MAGEVSKDITKRFLLPADIVDAHEQGLIHFHDADYFAQHMHNCCLVNLEDMLQNGTVISETMIEKPHSFSTACNIATQAIAQIASSQYGGQSISLAHLAPFVQISREKFIKQVAEEFKATGIDAGEDKIKEVAELRVRDEIKRGVQMIPFQVIIFIWTTNEQEEANEMLCPPYCELAICAIACVAILQAVEKLCGFSIIVSLITVPFWSISSRFTRQQLCICCAK